MPARRRLGRLRSRNSHGRLTQSHRVSSTRPKVRALRMLKHLVSSLQSREVKDSTSKKEHTSQTKARVQLSNMVARETSISSRTPSNQDRCFSLIKRTYNKWTCLSSKTFCAKSSQFKE